MADAPESPAGPAPGSRVRANSETRTLDVMTHLPEFMPNRIAGADLQSAIAMFPAQAQRRANGAMASFGASAGLSCPRGCHEIWRPGRGSRARSRHSGSVGLLESDRL